MLLSFEDLQDSVPERFCTSWKALWTSIYSHFDLLTPQLMEIRGIGHSLLHFRKNKSEPQFVWRLQVLTESYLWLGSQEVSDVYWIQQHH